ncbi:MAG: glycosyl hydrolase [Methylotenera sp.]|nr:MAG: glycosyl hydrolase [Methylotenera sp.]PPD17216.1 MAG: glycosyl hydrolase [Methylotenera sp.]
MVVVFGCDESYVMHLSVAIKSLIENNSDTHMIIFVINSDISSKNWDNIKSLDIHKKHTLINEKVSEFELNDLVTKGQFTKATYYRLLIETLVPYDKVLYIDSDVVVNGSLRNFWNFELKDHYLAAVEDPGYDENYLEMSPNARYFNAGVMLINLKKWRDELTSQQVIKFIRTQESKLTWLDQCALNAVINGRWARVSPKYNLQTSIIGMDFKDKQIRYDFCDTSEAIRHPTIIHYTGWSKPWHAYNDHPYKKNIGII